MFDLILAGGTVIDGTCGARPVRADVGVHRGRITAVCDLRAVEARERIDATACWVTPGFIDAHSHSDTYLLLEPDAPSKVSQGITTEVVGQCGGSGVPALDDQCLASDWAAMIYPRCSGGRGRLRATGEPGSTWRTVAEYRALWEEVRPAVNAKLYVGHNTLRKGVMGYAPRPADAGETARMIRNLEQALDEGASGLSTGLVYQPGKFALPDEVLKLASAAAARGAGYATHMRSEGDHLLEALDEVLALTRATGIRIQISHLKTAHPRNWHKIDAALERIERARALGLAVYADRYPYTFGATELDMILPNWASDGGPAVILRTLDDPETRARVVAELDAAEIDWSGVIVGGCYSSPSQAYCGSSLADAARQRGETPGATAAWLIREGRAKTGAFFGGMSEDNLRRIYRQPWVMVGSDASLRAPTGVLGADHPHPRAYGTMPRFFRMAVDEGLMDASEAIHRMTGLPAEAFGLSERGRIAPGYHADVAVWDPTSFASTATYGAPHCFATGMRHVVINGAVTYDNGRFTGRRSGIILHHT
ncbi:MAG: D-aminoacylase [Lentisphaerae bacterium]|nr:D-aminoacylase [Lentisphaerota bacterium]